MTPTIDAWYGEERVKFVIREGAVNLKAIRKRFKLSHVDLDGVCFTEDLHGWSEGSKFKEGDKVKVTGATVAAAAAAQPPAAPPGHQGAAQGMGRAGAVDGLAVTLGPDAADMGTLGVFIPQRHQGCATLRRRRVCS